MSDDFFVHPTAVVDEPAEVGTGTRIWHFCHVMAGARIGRDCVLGQNVFVADSVVIGDRVKIQNNVSVYRGCIIEEDVFLGPSCVLTNVNNPRAHVERKDRFEETLIRKGATIGANATIVCGVRIGRYAMVGAGAVVTRDVDDHHVVYGVPARPRGFACRCGALLPSSPLDDSTHDKNDGIGSVSVGCPRCGTAYRLEGDHLRAAASGRA